MARASRNTWRTAGRADSDEPPLRWAAGADAVAAFEQEAQQLLAQADAHRDLSSSLAYDDAIANA